MAGFYNLDEMYLCLEICIHSYNTFFFTYNKLRKGQVASLKIQLQEDKMKAW